MKAKTRNEAARERASTDPEAVADEAMKSEVLYAVLESQVLIVDDAESYTAVRTDGLVAALLDGPEEQFEIPAARIELPATVADADRVQTIGDLAEDLWLRSRVASDVPGFDSRANAEAVCGALARLPTPERDGLALLTLVVEAMPVKVEPETRKDRRILPRIVISESRPAREAGMLFGGLHDGRPIQALDLPLFPKVAPEKQVPILDLVDAAGLPVMVRGRGAPLPMRLFVRVLASVRPEHRRLPTVRVAVTMRELRDGLFPNRSYRPARDWQKLRYSLIHAKDYAIHDGRGRWWPLALRSMPDHPGLDDLIVLDVAFPPGSCSGPVIDLPEMDALSVGSASRWRAYIAAHTLAWQPGTTRVPAPRIGGRFVWTRKRAAYPVLTLEDRRRLAFGAGEKKHRTRAEIDAAFRHLPGLVVVTESEARDRTGEVGREQGHALAGAPGGCRASGIQAFNRGVRAFNRGVIFPG